MTASEQTADLRVVRPDLQPRLDPVDLVVARFPAGSSPNRLPAGFVSVVSDEYETTVVCAADVIAELADSAPLAVERGWRRISFAGPLPWEIVGFLAEVATRLAEAHVPFTSMSGFTTDHVLVRAAHAGLAVAVLSGEPTPPQRPGTNP
jgi:hypothetical protein